MDPAAFHVVYIDRRARCNRVECRGNRASGAVNGYDENWAVGRNLESLLLVYSKVSICTDAQTCVAVLSEIESSSLNPILLLIDVPLLAHPEEENTGQDGRHDSGVAANPTDILGLGLLRFICSEIDSGRMSSLIVPVVLLTDDDDQPHHLHHLQHHDPRQGSRANDNVHAARELQCVDNGAWDVVKCPLSSDSVKALHLHCYRAKKLAVRTRKRSWVGIDEPKNDNYSYLRENMVRELMTEICSSKRSKISTLGGRIRVSEDRAQIARQSVGSWDFSAHEFSDDELVVCAQTMFEHAFTMPDVKDFAISSDRLIEFLLACRGSYNVHIPYHNFRHVVDVLQAVFFFLLQLAALPPFGSGDPPAKHPGSLSHIITPMDAFTLLVVAIGHDVGHPGVNNTFLIALKTPLAQLYNDKSVLESFHCAAFSQVVKRHWPEAWDLRKTMIDMILATDMALHSDFMVQLEKLRRRYEDEMKGCNYDGLSPKVVLEHRTLLCALLIKCADISNVARTHECSAQWATILIDEFARQANMEHELNMPSTLVAPPVTGSTIALAKSQVGFMKLFAIPLFESLSKVLPEMSFSVTELMANKHSWSTKIAIYNAEPPPESSAITSSANMGANNRPGGSALAPPRLGLTRGSSGNVADPPSPRHRVHSKPQVVLGTAMMDSQMSPPATDTNTPMPGSGAASPRPEAEPSGVAAQQHARAGNGNANAVTYAAVQAEKPAVRTNGYGPLSDKRPTYQHSTEHLKAGAPPSEGSNSPDRPRSSPPDLGDCSDVSFTKTCCNPAAAVVANGTVERRSSRFFKKVKLWKSWRKEPPDG